jgi:hypothetical protein
MAERPSRSRIHVTAVTAVRSIDRGDSHDEGFERRERDNDGRSDHLRRTPQIYVRSVQSSSKAVGVQPKWRYLLPVASSM